MKKYIFIISSIIIIFAVLLFFYSEYIIYQNKKNYELELITFQEKNSECIFEISECILYSSANAINSSVAGRPYWDLSICQYTDIGITINNQVTYIGDYNKNTIKNLYIDNINFNYPILGEPSLYYKDPEYFASSKVDKESLISDYHSFNILSPNITLTYVNNNIINNYILDASVGKITFDGSLLELANIKLEAIQCKVSFNVNIINAMDELYICNIYFDIPLEDIYNGYTVKNLNSFKFGRIL